MWDKLKLLRKQYLAQRIMDSIDYEKFAKSKSGFTMLF